MNHKSKLSMLTYLFTKTPLAFFVQNLWRDEAFTYLVSDQSIGDILRTTAVDFNPPLYYLFMHYWMLIFGSSEIAMRSVSLLFYILTIFIMFEIMVLVFKIPFKRALLYLLLIMYNPVLLTYAFEARMYMMATFFITLSYFALWTGRKKLYIVAVILALYTHYFTVFLFVAQIISEGIRAIRSHNWKNSFAYQLHSFKEFKKKSFQLLHRFGLFLISGFGFRIFIIFICFIPWLLFLLSFHDFSISEFWIIKPPQYDIWYIPFVLYTGYQRVFGQYYHDQAGYTSFHVNLNILIWGVFLLPWILFTGHIVRSIVIKKSRSVLKASWGFVTFKHHLQLILWSFLPPIVLYVISQFSTPVYHPRYFMFSVVGFLLYLILTIETTLLQNEKRIIKLSSLLLKLPRSFIKHKYVSRATNIFILAIIIGLLLFVTHQYNNLNLRYNAKRTTAPLFQEIDQSMKENDKVYLTRELDYFLAKYYMKNDSIFIFGIPYEEIHPYIGKVLIPPNTIVSGIPVYPARAFIVYYDRYVLRSEM